MIGKVLLDGRACGDRRARTARGRGALHGLERQGVRRARAALVGRRRDASTRSATCSCATSPTARSRAPTRAGSTRPRPLDRVARRGARTTPRCSRTTISRRSSSRRPRARAGRDARASARALRCATPATAPSSLSTRYDDADALLRGRARALAAGRRRAARRSCSGTGAAASTRDADDAVLEEAQRRAARRGRRGGRGARPRRSSSGVYLDAGATATGRTRPRAGARRSPPTSRPSRSKAPYLLSQVSRFAMLAEDTERAIAVGARGARRWPSRSGSAASVARRLNNIGCARVVGVRRRRRPRRPRAGAGRPRERRQHRRGAARRWATARRCWRRSASSTRRAL